MFKVTCGFLNITVFCTKTKKYHWFCISDFYTGFLKFIFLISQSDLEAQILGLYSREYDFLYLQGFLRKFSGWWENSILVLRIRRGGVVPSILQHWFCTADFAPLIFYPDFAIRFFTLHDVITLHSGTCKFANFSDL